MSPLNDGSSPAWRFVFRLLMVLTIVLCGVVVFKVELMQQKLSGLAKSQIGINDAVIAMSGAQAEALKKLLAASDQRTKDEAVMAKNLLAGQDDLKASVRKSLDEFT